MILVRLIILLMLLLLLGSVAAAESNATADGSADIVSEARVAAVFTAAATVTNRCCY